MQVAAPQSSQPANPLLADCSGDRNTQSCQSYNELIRSDDKHLREILSTNSYVCFRPEEDVFLVIAFHQPLPNESYGDMIAYERFKNGLSDDFQLAYGTWKRDANGLPALNDSKPPADKAALVSGSALITNDQLRFDYSFKNLAANTTDYSIELRRSTLRFSEHFESPETKGKGTVTLEHSGYCVSFHNR
jgi:hypothetical protein